MPAGDLVLAVEQAVQSVSPGPRAFPATHSAHVVAPVMGVLVFGSIGDQLPNGHGLQTALVLAPMTVEKKPASQGVHAPTPVVLYLPAGQLMHVVGAVCGMCIYMLLLV